MYCDKWRCSYWDETRKVCGKWVCLGGFTEAAAKKIMNAYTGGRPTVKEQRKLGGDPSICTIYAYYYYLFEEDDRRLLDLERECKSGGIICGDCKARLVNVIKTFLKDFQKKREKAKDIIDQFLLK